MFKRKTVVPADTESISKNVEKAASPTQFESVSPNALLGDRTSVYESARGSSQESMELGKLLDEGFGLELQTETPATVTWTKRGLNELPPTDMLIMLLIWSMRCFIPWISAWHSYNVYVTANPPDWEGKEILELFRFHDLVIFGGFCGVTLVSSALSDVFRIKYYQFLVFFLLYSLCPIAGAAVDVILRSRPYDPTMYKWWFTSVILFRWSAVIPEMILPVQFSCIFEQKQDMSRQAHYNWSALFVFIQSVNSFIVFWLIPPKCPTAEWTQITVWIVIGFLMCFVIMSTAALTFLINSTWGASILGRSIKVTEGSKRFVFERGDIAKRLRVKKLIMASLVIIPIAFTGVINGAVELFYPDQDWDQHRFVSATALHLMGRVLGVIFPTVTLYVIRKIFSKFKIPTEKADLFHFPHVLLLTSLITFLVRFVTLEALQEGEMVYGPIPSDGTTVVEFYNADVLNRSICVRSNFFTPLTVRPFHRGSIELQDLNDGDNVTFSVCVDPCTTPVVYTHGSFSYERDKWTTFMVYLPLKNPDEDEDVQLRPYRNLLVSQATGAEKVRPGNYPSLIFMNTFVNAPEGFYYTLHWSDVDVFKEPVKLSGENHVVVLNRTGNLHITYGNDKTTDVTVAAQTLLTVEKHSVYSMLLCLGTLYTTRTTSFAPPFTVKLLTYKMAEVAGPNSTKRPSKQVLENDWAIKVGMFTTGMASSGIDVGGIYLFWLDPPSGKYRTLSIAFFWIVTQGVGLVPKLGLIDINVTLWAVLLGVFVVLLGGHVLGAYHVYSQALNFRGRRED